MTGNAWPLTSLRPGCARRRVEDSPPLLGTNRDELVQRYAYLVGYVVGGLGVSVPGLFDRPPSPAPLPR